MPTIPEVSGRTGGKRANRIEIRRLFANAQVRAVGLYWPSRGHLNGTVAPRITAYFDESYDREHSHMFALAGWAAWDVEWELFDLAWRAVLADYGVRDLHMREYESMWGDFMGWDSARKVRFLSALIDTFEASAAPPSPGPIGFWSALPLKDYDRLIGGRPLKWEDDPTFLCFLHCIQRLLPFTNGTPGEVRIDFVFDWNPKLEQRTRAIFSQLRIVPVLSEFCHRLGDVRFASRRDTPPLQAADLLAYECYKHVVNFSAGSPRPQRKSLARLKSRIVYSELLPTELLERLGVDLERYYNLLAALGIPRARIETL